MYNFGPINQITNNKLNKNKVDKNSYNSKVSELENKNLEQDNNINQKVNLSNYNSKIADLETVNKRQDAQISQMIANPGEPTEGNSELLDIRVGYDGTEYNTAGDAVRKQILGNLDLIKYNSLCFGKFTYDGYINTEDGRLETNVPGFKSTDYIEIPKLGYLKLIIFPNFKYEEGLVIYDENKNFITSFNRNKVEILEDGRKYFIVNIEENWCYFRMTTPAEKVNDTYIFLNDYNLVLNLFNFNLVLDLCYNNFIYDGYLASDGHFLLQQPAGFKSTDFIKISRSMGTKLIIFPKFKYEEGIFFYDSQKHVLATFNKLDVNIFKPEEDFGVIDISNTNYTYFRMSAAIENIEDIHVYMGNTFGETLSDNVIIQKTLTGFDDVSKWSDNTGNYVTFNEDNIIINTKNLKSGDVGIQITPRYITPSPLKNMLVYTDLDVTDGEVNIYLFARDKTTNNYKYIVINSYTKNTKETFSVDLSYHDVYSNIDLSGNLGLVLSCPSGSYATIRTFRYSFDDYEGSSLPGKNLTETINNIQKEFNKKANIEDIPSVSSGDNILISPDGNRFIPTITNEGIVNYVPIVPNKTLFIGNSLLIGWDTFGMCAKDSSHDYYHYITEYIKNLKSDAVFDKISGTTFEGATSELAATSWMQNTLSSKLSNDIDLVIIQLSDNVNTTEKNETFKTTCIQLIRYIRSICTKARVVWVSAWYYSSAKQSIIQEACQNTGSIFINIKNLVTTENKGAIGDEIHKDDGSTTIVDSGGVT